MSDQVFVVTTKKILFERPIFGCVALTRERARQTARTTNFLENIANVRFRRWWMNSRQRPWQHVSRRLSCTARRTEEPIVTWYPSAMPKTEMRWRERLRNHRVDWKLFSFVAVRSKRELSGYCTYEESTSLLARTGFWLLVSCCLWLIGHGWWLLCGCFYEGQRRGSYWFCACRLQVVTQRIQIPQNQRTCATMTRVFEKETENHRRPFLRRLTDVRARPSTH